MDWISNLGVTTMNKRDKAIIKLLGAIATQLAVIATNLNIINVDKREEAYGVRKTNRLKDAYTRLQFNIIEIDKVVEEATNDQ